MPLFRKELLKQDIETGIWKITETADELKSLQQLTIPEELFYSGLRNETRKKHWLSYRLLLKEFPEVKGPISYDEYGKPGLPMSQYDVSVSHSGDYSSIILSTSHEVGTDIERIRQRIERVSERFLSQKELEMASGEQRLTYLTVLWCAKEAIYKITGKPVLDFQDIFVNPFDLDNNRGEFTALITKAGSEAEFELNYDIFEDYVLVSAWKKEKQG